MLLDSRQSLLWEEAVLPINMSQKEPLFILKNFLQMPLIIPLPSLAHKACWGAINSDLNFAGASEYKIVSSNGLRCNSKQVQRWGTRDIQYCNDQQHHFTHIIWLDTIRLYMYTFLQRYNTKHSQVWILSVGQNSTNKHSVLKVNVLESKKCSRPNFDGIRDQSVFTVYSSHDLSRWDGDRVQYGNVRVMLWVMLCWETLGPISA